MRNVVRFPGTHRARDEAMRWIVRIDRGDLDASVREEFASWLRADARHREEFRRAAELWDGLDHLTLLSELFPLEQQMELPVSANDRWYHRVAMPAAAALVVVMAAVVLWRTVEQGAAVAPVELAARVTVPHEKELRTAVGTQSRFALDDGSIMTLNTASRARIRFAARERAVFLDAGEAHFAVSKDAARPFVVYAGSGSVRAVGTAFSVRLRGDSTQVVVAEGVVDVRPLAGTPAVDGTGGHARAEGAVQLHAGNMATYSSRVDLQRELAPREIEQKLAWRAGKWDFGGETLAEVVAEASRYTDARIVIVDPAVASLRIGGYFDAGDIPHLLAALESGFGIRVTRTEAGVIELARAATAQDGSR